MAGYTLLLTEDDHADAIEFALANCDRAGRARAYARQGFGHVVCVRSAHLRDTASWLTENATSGWRTYPGFDAIEFAFRDHREAVAFRMAFG